MSVINSLIPGCDLNGFMVGKILTRDDQTKRGRVGVYIPRVMNLISNSNEQKEDSITSKDTSSNDDNNELSGTVTLKSVNFLWAKRATDRYKHDKTSLGRWVVPPIGASVFVFFLDGRPDQLYYLPFGPDDGITDTSEGNPDLEIIHESIKGGSIAFDSTEDVEKFYIQLSEGQGIEIDIKDNKIFMHNKENAATVELKEKEINVKADTINVEGTDVTVKGSSSVTIDASTGKITLKTPDSALWQPNILPQCPLAGIPHGGKGGGIQNLGGS